MSAVEVAPSTDRRPSSAAGAGRDFVAGVGFLLRGIGMYARSPRLMLLGLIPAVIAGIVLVAVLAALIYFIDDLSSAVTWFADDWSTGWRHAIEATAGVTIVGGALLLSFVGYTALTLVIGEPFYEAISKNVEDRLGGLPGEVDIPFWRTLPRSILDSLQLLLLTALCGIPLFLAGFIPIVGETVVPVIGALVGGWFLTHELIGVPFERRGLRLRDRRRMLKQRRALATGFGAAAFVCFLIPFGAVLIMPAAVAGATMLSRDLFGMSTRVGSA
jgi:CysZ protein